MCLGLHDIQLAAFNFCKAARTKFQLLHGVYTNTHSVTATFPLYNAATLSVLWRKFHTKGNNIKGQKQEDKKAR